MGILDQAAGALGGMKGGGVKAMLMQQLVSYLSKPGALGSLTSSFQQHGLGNILESWLGKGQNLPISAQQVQQVLPRDWLSGMAGSSGLGEQDAARELSSMLPQVIDKISPDGQAPSDNQLGGLLASAGKWLS